MSAGGAEGGVCTVGTGDEEEEEEEIGIGTREIGRRRRRN